MRRRDLLAMICSSPLISCCVVLLSCFLAIEATAQLHGFSTVGLASTPSEANQGFEARARMITEWNACRKHLGQWFNDELDWTTVAIAKLELARMGGTPCLGTTTPAQLVAEVNDAILHKTLIPVSPPWYLGTTSLDIPGCPRKGELDVALRGLITILYRYWGSLSSAARDHAVQGLLKPNVSGPPPAQEFVNLCVIRIPETENHVNMIETTRYLTNQLLGIDNGANRAWLLKRLQGYLQGDFQEYNSRHYQRYSLFAIQNLFDFAQDRDVHFAAQMVLDYVSAKFAISSNGLRRTAPFRRRKDYKDYTNLLGQDSDEQTWRHLILAGIPENYRGRNVMLDLRFDQDSMQLAAVGMYRVPDMILDLILNKAHNSYYQRIRHAGVELYASSPQALITGGGVWVPSAHGHDEFNCYADVGWPLPTTIMPTAGGLVDDYAKLIRIDGWKTHERIRAVPSCWKDYAGRINACVAPGFACGINPVIPAVSPYVCADSSGKRIVCGTNTSVSVQGPFGVGATLARDPWSFVDASAFNPGFFAAVYTANWRTVPGTSDLVSKQKLTPDEVDTFGFIEVFDRTLNPTLTFDDFRGGVLARNGSRTYKPNLVAFSPLEYVTTAGRKIRFNPYTGNALDWGVLAIDDQPMGTRIDQWPLAQGEIMDSDGRSGMVTIENPYLHMRLILDMRDPDHPTRSEYSTTAPEFATLPPCKGQTLKAPDSISPMMGLHNRQTNPDWLGIWGDTGRDTDHDRIVVRIAAAATGHYRVSTLERVQGATRPLTMDESAVGIASSLMPNYAADHYAASPSGAPRAGGSTDTSYLTRQRTRDGQDMVVARPHPQAAGATSGSMAAATLRPTWTLVLPNRVTLQLALGCIPGKASQGLYLRYFRTANDGQMVTDVMLVHSQDPPH